MQLLPTHRRPTRVATATGFVLLTALLGYAQTTDTDDNWPKFRGPSAGVVTDDPALPETWSRTENVVWNVEVPGQGWSSPIVWGDLVFVTSVISDEPRQQPGRDVIPEPGQEGAPVTSVDGIVSTKPLASPYTWMLYAFDFDTGQIQWECALRTGLPSNPKHPKNTYASETPVTDGEFVYVFHGNAGLFAVDFDGQIAWSREVNVPDAPPDSVTEARITPGGRVLDEDYFIGIGQAASPAVHQDRVFVAADHESRSWSAPRSARGLARSSGMSMRRSRQRPTGGPVRSSGRTTSARRSSSRGTTMSGRSAWTATSCGSSRDSRSARHPPHSRRTGCSTSALDSPLSFSVRSTPSALGRAATSHSARTRRATRTWPGRNPRPEPTCRLASSIYGDLFYGLYTQGFLTAHDATTGEEVYGRVRIARGTGGFTSSPWAYNGKVFAMSEDGDTYVIEAGPDYKLLGKNSLEEMVNATPAIVRGSVIIRTVSSLWRIGKI